MGMNSSLSIANNGSALGGRSLAREFSAPPESLPFCFGAAGLPALWCFFHGRGGLGVAFLLVSFVCMGLGRVAVAGWLLAEIAGWTITFAMGSSGSAIAWSERGYHTMADLARGEKGWTVAGAVFLALRVLLTLINVGVVLSR